MVPFLFRPLSLPVLTRFGGTRAKIKKKPIPKEKIAKEIYSKKPFNNFDYFPLIRLVDKVRCAPYKL